MPYVLSEFPHPNPRFFIRLRTALSLTPSSLPTRVMGMAGKFDDLDGIGGWM